MSRIARALPLLLAVPLWGQDLRPFEPLPASEYLCRLTQAEVTVAAEPYDEPQKVQAAFERVDANQFGFLPILVVISRRKNRLHASNGRVVSPL